MAVSELTKEGKLTSVAGGGDTVSALKKAGCETLTIEARTDDFRKDVVEAVEVLDGLGVRY
jgi:hypothetical protein